MSALTDAELATRFNGFIPLSNRAAINAALNGTAIVRLGIALYEADQLSAAADDPFNFSCVSRSSQRIDASPLTLPGDGLALTDRTVESVIGGPLTNERSSSHMTKTGNGGRPSD